MSHHNIHRSNSIVFPLENEDSMDLDYSTPQAQSQTPSKNKSEKIEIIDLVTPIKNSIVTTNQTNYRIRTLTLYNAQRRTILPTFPNMTNNHQLDLLLANVPPNLLSTEEIARRQHGFYSAPFKIENIHPTAGSLMITHYHTYFTPIFERFKIDLSILDHNYYRMNHFMDLFRKSRSRLLTAARCSEDLIDLSDIEKPQLLEFFLQMDVDLFYMKTCSFRNAQPRSMNEGLFCLQPPECLYAMSKCGNCDLCTKSSSINNSITPVQFDNFQPHQFVNGYQSILNAPVDCDTKNFIYVLTCICGNFDYICETKFSLSRRLQDHRLLVNNLICKFLVGGDNFKKIQLNLDLLRLIAHKENMHLYSHTSRCAKAIQIFLDYNPTYWTFVPLTIAQANEQNLKYNHRINSKKITTNNLTLDQNIQNCLSYVPKPPPGYKFSKQQIDQQMQFFISEKNTESFNVDFDVYNATIIAVLPPSTSDLLRRMVHSLFVTHTEAKLNTLGHLFDIPSDRNVHNGVWCSNLIANPFLSS